MMSDQPTAQKHTSEQSSAYSTQSYSTDLLQTSPIVTHQTFESDLSTIQLSTLYLTTSYQTITPCGCACMENATLEEVLVFGCWRKSTEVVTMNQEQMVTVLRELLEDNVNILIFEE